MQLENRKEMTHQSLRMDKLLGAGDARLYTNSAKLTWLVHGAIRSSRHASDISTRRPHSIISPLFIFSLNSP